MAVLVGAVDGIAGDIHAAAAVDGGGLIHHALLQRRRQRQDLEGGARLIGVVQRLVAPLQQLHIGHGALPALDTLLQRLVADGQKVVQIVVGIRRHGQYAAGLGVHHDAAGAVGGGELIHHALDALFQIVLDGGVQRQRQVAAVLGGEILFIGIQHIVLRLILGGDDQSALPLQLLLVIGLQPIQPRVLVAHEADDLRRQRAVGIVPLRVRHQVYARDLVLVHIRAHLGRCVLVRP